MDLGPNIRINLELKDGNSNALVTYDNQIVGGIQALDLKVSAGAFGELIERFKIRMWSPSEIFADKDQLSVQNKFIEEATLYGAEIDFVSVFENDAESEELEDQAEPIDPEESVDSIKDIAKVAAAMATLAGIATLFSSKEKKSKVQKKAVVNKLKSETALKTR
jgi:hypothetical protein